MREGVTADITIDWDRGVVRLVSGQQTLLRAQSLSILRELHARADTLVSKEDLIAKVWRGVAVSEDSLVQCISELRKALGDDDHAIIRTLPKRGYLLESEHLPALPKYLSTLAAFGQAAPAMGQGDRKNSIAVLPFANLSGDPEHEYFSDGLIEDVITELSNVPGLFVIARNSSFAYKGNTQTLRQIAYDLGVRNILEGSIRKSARKLRITTHLHDAESGQQLWAERFDRDIEDVFALQDEITERIVTTIVGKLNAPLSAKTVPKNLLAYDLFLRGRELWATSLEECMLGRRCLEEALSLEPGYAEVLSELGVNHRVGWQFWFEPINDNADMAYELTSKAISLAPSNVPIITNHGWVALTCRKYEEAAHHFHNALGITPNHAPVWLSQADMYILTGEAEKALESATNAFRLNPAPPAWYNFTVGAALVRLGRFRDALEVLVPAIEPQPSSRLYAAVALAKLGNSDAAKKHTELFMQFAPQWRARSYVQRRAFRFQADRDWWLKAFLEAGLRE